MSGIKVGDTIRHWSVPTELLDVEVLEVGDCSDGAHAAYLIQDPGTNHPDWVCSRDFVKVGQSWV